MHSSIYDDGASTSADHPHQPVYPPSPKHQNTVYNTSDSASVNEFGPIPISPHVNVPNTHAYNHVPPPLPPRRRERKESDAAHLAQIQQAPDAPQLPPRDMSPPPLPPRLGLVHTAIKKTCTYNSYNEEGLLREHNLKLPHTSTIMMRRNSAMERACKDGNGVSNNVVSSSSLPTSNSIDSTTNPITPQENNPVKKFRHNVTSAPVNRRPRLAIETIYFM